MFKHNLNLSLFLFAILNGYATAGKHDFDVLIFTQHWPQTVCYTWKEKDPSHSCALPRDKGEWTIHGIWPSQFNKLGPAFCNPSLPFDPNALAPLAGQLKEKWIDIEYGRESSSLWEHEWNKHGTCAAVLPQLSTEQKYFNEGLVLLSKYDMKNVLARANIVPGFSYRVPDILNGIQQVLGTHATVECRKNRVRISL
ncbi:Ribonuclease Oy [Dufourea novaeangliae]|uniref:Ribonuclease Oy n=1 Tax=Dufourea novaeangliae TaxID=178035 RepID=A0A154PCU2_DUFNO|nr:Ribonuclease Oy [Dufourea novaeangliae]